MEGKIIITATGEGTNVEMNVHGRETLDYMMIGLFASLFENGISIEEMAGYVSNGMLMFLAQHNEE
jgi:hypothetical protein